LQTSTGWSNSLPLKRDFEMKNILFIIVISIVLPAKAKIQLDVKDVVECYTPSENQSDKQRRAGLVIERVIKGGNVNEQGLCLGWSDMGGAKNWYMASSRSGVISIDVENNKLVGQWPIKNWQYMALNKELFSSYASFPRHNINQIADFHFRSSNPMVDGVGCLSHKPFRYGKVSQSQTENDLVFLSSTDFIVFSPHFQRVIFAEKYDQSDWVRKDDPELDRLYELPRQSYYGIPKHQFISSISYYGSGDTYAATRSYSKIYNGDFDDDGNPDIVVWRKTYRSNTLEDPVAGFSLLRNEWQHFEQDLEAQKEYPDGVTGEYIPQLTVPGIVQQWLIESELTWDEGFPSVSECDGEEGALIPEIHDPLLNDPDVLGQ